MIRPLALALLLALPAGAQQGTNADAGQGQQVVLLEDAKAALLNDAGFLAEVARRAVPPGAVVAFATETCPEGWTAFEEGAGRFILGEDDARPLLFRQGRPQFSTGGRPTVTLTERELPRHGHALSTSKNADMHDALGGSPVSYGIDRSYDAPAGSYSDGFGVLEDALSKAGAGEAFDIMPPFIALLLCRKT